MQSAVILGRKNVYVEEAILQLKEKVLTVRAEEGGGH